MGEMIVKPGINIITIEKMWDRVFGLFFTCGAWNNNQNFYYLVIGLFWVRIEIGLVLKEKKPDMAYNPEEEDDNE